MTESDESFAKAREAAERERQAHESQRAFSENLATRGEALRALVAGFRDQIEQAMALLDRSAESMGVEAGSLTATSDQVRAQTSSVSEAAAGTMNSIDQLSAASTQLVASIAEIGRNAGESADVSKTAADLARHAGQEIEHLAKHSETVGAVVEIIRGIAAQTSLLALNATIEAARAGEMGRGFAIVASEVKTLSAQTAKATDEVSGQISAMQEATRRCLAAMREIVSAVGAVESLSDAIAQSVNAQSMATSEIAYQVRLSFEGAQRSADMAGGFEAMTVKTHGAAAQLEETAVALARQAQQIRSGVARFCSDIAAA
jgi:methyl-accepting chemotaxis protein